MRTLIFIGLKIFEIVKWPIIVGGWLCFILIAIGIIGLPGRYFCDWYLPIIGEEIIAPNFVYAWNMKCYAIVGCYGIASLFYIVCTLIVTVLVLVILFYIIAMLVELWDDKGMHAYTIKTNWNNWIAVNWKKADKILLKWRKK